MAYWRKVFARAWADTKQSFGWNQKTAATVLVAAIGLVVTFFQLGFAATVASALGLLSAGAALSSIVAGAVLFVWNFFSAQANLYVELSKTSSERSPLWNRHSQSWRSRHRIIRLFGILIA